MKGPEDSTAIRKGAPYLGSIPSTTFLHRQYQVLLETSVLWGVLTDPEATESKHPYIHNQKNEPLSKSAKVYQE